MCLLDIQISSRIAVQVLCLFLKYLFSYGQAYQMKSISKISACLISESNILLLSQMNISLIINGPEHFLVFSHLIMFYLL